MCAYLKRCYAINLSVKKNPSILEIRYQIGYFFQRSIGIKQRNYEYLISQHPK